MTPGVCLASAPPKDDTPPKRRVETIETEGATTVIPIRYALEIKQSNALILYY
jgi:hypothetical protein